ncbi:rhomboid family intramembrane serine protease [Geothrix campi]|uniref:rhomboid family intramembrane serine protease n=1 Tax=Geothrix campi TaxID=2966450 RepID=UPI002147CB65|nr:rhomboid family intramembrane serine protease [Geothrix sp. SG10]
MDIPYYPAKCLACGHPLPAHGAVCDACGHAPLKSEESTPGEEPLQTFIETREGPPTTAWVTVTLLGLNVALFIGMAATGAGILSPGIQDLTAWGANVGPLTAGGQWWRLLTSMFLHIGIIHLVFNMVVLFGIGCLVERLVGNAGFALVYLLAGLCGSLASIAWDPDVVSAGASGAIFGLYGVLLGFLLRDRQSIPKEVLKHTAKNALIFLGYNLVFGLAKAGIDVAAHLGGLLGGFICGYAIALPPTAEGASRRTRTNLLVLAGGAVGLIVLVLALPKDRGIASQVAQAEKIEKLALSQLEEAATKVRSGTLSDIGFADAIEGEVIPTLHQFRSRLEVLAKNPKVRAGWIESVERYSDRREELFHQIAQALRTGNEENADRALSQLSAASNQLQSDLKPPE